METNGSSALAVYDKPALMLPAIPTEGEIRSLVMIADYAARSNFLRSTAPRNQHDQRQADAFFVIMYGRELGIPPMTALKMIFVLDGQPSASTQAIVGLARRRGVEIDIPDPLTVTDSATVRVKRPGGEWKSFTFTMDMARKMGLSGKKNWTGMQPVMLIWRAAGMGLRFEAGDYIGGLYPTEELSPDTQVNEDGEPVGDIIISKPEPVTPEPTTPLFQRADDFKDGYRAGVAAASPRMASCLASDSDCRGQFAVLCKQLDITNDGPYLKHLGNLSKYSDYPGTFDELCNKMRELFVWFVNEGHRVGEDEPAPEPDPVAEAAAQIPMEQAAQTLGSVEPRRIGEKPGEPHIREAGAVALVEGKVKAGASPFGSDKAALEMSDAEKAAADKALANSDIPTGGDMNPSRHKRPNGAANTMLIDMPIGGD